MYWCFASLAGTDLASAAKIAKITLGLFSHIKQAGIVSRLMHMYMHAGTHTAYTHKHKPRTRTNYAGAHLHLPTPIQMHAYICPNPATHPPTTQLQCHLFYAIIDMMMR